MAVTASPTELLTAPDQVGVFFEPDSLVLPPETDRLVAAPPSAPVSPELLSQDAIRAIMYSHRYRIADTLGSLIEYMEVDAELGNRLVVTPEEASELGADRHDKRQGFLHRGSNFLADIATEIGSGSRAPIGQGLYESRHQGLAALDPTDGRPMTAFGHFEPTDRDVKQGLRKANNEDWLYLLLSMKSDANLPFHNRQENFGHQLSYWKMY